MDNAQNQDDIIGMNMPRGSYALSGFDWQVEPGDTESPPIIVNGMSPGVGVDQEDDDWDKQYGATYDSFLSIVDGSLIQASIEGNTLTSPYTSIPSTQNDNIWSLIGGTQQIKYIVSGEDIADGETKDEGFGAVEDTRGIAIRLPMMGVGYGRSREMLELFDDSSKMNRTLWNAGSIDVRWDEKRKTWATYNDLIVDHESQGLGTAVFSTNPDLSEGFPFLKGRLEDVWWVRQPFDLDGTDGSTDGATTAKIMTHLEHCFYDDEENGAAPLNTIFVVPHKSLPPGGTPDVCFTQNDENKLGNEVTGESDAIALKTEVGFWFDSTQYGPIKFGESLSKIENQVCCTNSSSKLFVGEMIFVDAPVPECGTEPGDVGADEDDCVWVPAVRIDECELVGKHFETFFNNDVAIAKSTHGICMSVYDWSTNLVGEIVANDAILKDGIECNNDEIKKVAATLIGVIQQVAATQSLVTQLIYQNVQNAFNELVVSINAALADCGCESFVVAPNLFNNDTTITVPGVIIDVDDCDVGIGSVNPFDCANCNGIELEAPCAENQDEAPFVVGLPCAGSTLKKEPDYDNVGGCQTG